MSGNSEWDNRVTDSLKNFDLSSPEVKQQFGKSGIENLLLTHNILFWDYVAFLHT